MYGHHTYNQRTDRDDQSPNGRPDTVLLLLLLVFLQFLINDTSIPATDSNNAPLFTTTQRAADWQE